MVDINVGLNTNYYNLLPIASLGIFWDYSLQLIVKINITKDNQILLDDIYGLLEIATINCSDLSNIKNIIMSYAIINKRYQNVPYSEVAMTGENEYPFAIPYREPRNYCIHSDDNNWFGSSGCIVVSRRDMKSIHLTLRQFKSFNVYFKINA